MTKPSRIESGMLNGLSTSVRKKLDETAKGISLLADKLRLGELQPLYDRLLTDRDDLNIWNELSFDMMTYESSGLNRHQS